MRLAQALVVISAATALAGSRTALHAQSHTLRLISVPVTSCQFADSLLGPLAGKHSKVKAYVSSDSGPALFTVESDQVGQTFRVHSLQITFRGTSEPMTSIPDGDISLMLSGDAGRYVLSTREVPAVSIALTDSIVISPHPIFVGSFEGPASLTVAPISAPLTAPSLLAIARSDTVVAYVGTIRIQPSPTFRERMRDAYRVALCGYHR